MNLPIHQELHESTALKADPEGHQEDDQSKKSKKTLNFKISTTSNSFKPKYKCYRAHKIGTPITTYLVTHRIGEWSLLIVNPAPLITGLAITAMLNDVHGLDHAGNRNNKSRNQPNGAGKRKAFKHHSTFNSRS